MRNDNLAGEPEQADLDDDAVPDVDQHNLESEAPGEDVTDELLLADANRPDSKLTYNKGPEQWGYTPAWRLNRDNIGELSKAYEVEGAGGQTSAVVVPGDPPVMYFTSAPDNVYAVNARTGEKYWSYEYSPDNTEGLTVAKRGVGVWQDKVYLASHDVRLVALDRYTGEQLWRSEPAITERQHNEMNKTDRIARTQAPLVFKGKVFAGTSGYYGGWGAVSAFNADDGEILWQDTIVPEDEWVGETWRHGDGASWQSPAADPVTDTVVFPTGNAAPMFNGMARPGPNKHTNAVMAFDATSGERKWTFQLSPHDWWDYDTDTTPRILSVEVEGEETRAVSVEGKTGWSFLLDVETGKLLERSEAYAQQGTDEVPFMSIPPKGEENAKAITPTGMGATDWPTDSYSPKTGLLYIGANDEGSDMWWEPYEYDNTVIEPNTGGGTGPTDGIPPEDQGSYIAAVDPASGELKWRTEYMDMWPPAGSAGGTRATGGNLVFGASVGGSLVALDAETGERLWMDDTGEFIGGGHPVIWDDPQEDKQFVAVNAAGKMLVYSN